jgi:hypothetical protein
LSEAIGAKYKGVNKEPMDEAETAVWDKIQELAVRFEQADRIVLGVPMWNFAYPYKLKQLIDLACQRNMLFTYVWMVVYDEDHHDNIRILQIHQRPTMRRAARSAIRSHPCGENDPSVRLDWEQAALDDSQPGGAQGHVAGAARSDSYASAALGAATLVSPV